MGQKLHHPTVAGGILAMRTSYTIPGPVFDAALGCTGLNKEGKSVKAARSHLVAGFTVTVAGSMHGVSRQSTSAAARRIMKAAQNKLGTCPCCGAKIETESNLGELP